MSKGFTMLEVLVAIVLFSVSILAVAKMQIPAINTTQFNKEATDATALAQRVIEEYRTQSFGAGSPATCGTTVNGLAVACQATLNGSGSDEYKDITVTVTWNAKSITLSTIVAER